MARIPYFYVILISMFEFLKTVLIILWVYYALKLIARWLFPKMLPWIMKQIFKKAVGSDQPFGPQRDHSADSFSRGASNFDKHKQSRPKSKKVVGDYIDFEEVDD